MNELHVLVIPSWYPTWQAPTKGVFFKEQAEALSRAGVKIGVVYPELLSLRALGLQGVRSNRFQTSFREEDGIPTYRIHGWNVPRLRIGTRLWVQSATRLVDLYVQDIGKPDLLHAHGTLWGGYAAMLAAQRHEIPYLITEHSTAYARGLVLHWQEPYIRKALGRAAQVVAVGRNMAALLTKYVEQAKPEVIPNLVNPDFFTLPLRVRSIRPFRFLAVALLTPIKGIDVLIQAFAEVFRDEPDVLLEVGGDGPHRMKLGALSEALHVDHKVRFLGLLSREQVRGAMWRANAFVLPSLTETFGVVAIEALATGLPVVATRSGGPEEYIRPEVGCLAEPGNVKSLGRCLLEAYQNYEGLRTRESDIRAYAVTNFGERTVTETILKHYSQILENAAI